ncbi:MAG: glycerol-3-phosphate 1-O-acyltransferase PlsY [SAR202 cluster bacterium]|jgi:glycerol-3-phosphate acyltransferase PlsY|nr:acyl-phosphate glycerol 3-phosphate acyltransferase [Chloroflexota bacterium]MDP7231569.1 glycerol-3-phosphate 1-O-acyltransferase PlsY [Dehalococcoidia bacterium]MQG46877.1 glycerol-3-phosphate 1-O-acyltransferase PlsY [SAR202 cluster bacterium]|tara:strand:+ start:1924 stop:2535 length:612 start_codon:yes stop_codon:yes gene_type:complete
MMNDLLYIALSLVIAYLLGSIPTGIIIGKIWHRTDVRGHGSGSTGATNVLRVLGPSAGASVLIIDIFKGALAVFVASILTDVIWVKPLCGSIAIIGHIVPVFSKFKGGKGVATGIGAIFLVNPLAIVGVLIGVIVIAITRTASLGSIIGSAFGMIIMILTIIFSINGANAWDLIFAVPAPLIIFASHHENIRRLFSGNERKIQ